MAGRKYFNKRLYMSRGRVYEEATCPYCGYRDAYSFHVQADTLFCNNCDKEFAIELEVNVKVVSTSTID